MAKSNTTKDIQEAIKAISSAAQDAVHTIANAAAEAKAVVNVNAAEAARTLSANTSGDHDLLQRVDQKVDGLIITVDKISSRDNLFVLKEDFTFWRNILISGMFLTVVASILLKFFNQ